MEYVFPLPSVIIQIIYVAEENDNARTLRLNIKNVADEKKYIEDGGLYYDSVPFDF